MSSLIHQRAGSGSLGAAHGRKAARLALGLVLGALLLPWASAEGASADSYLARCPVAGASGRDRFTVTATEPAEPGCVSRALPVDAQSVLAVLPAPRRAAGAPEPEAVTIAGAADK